MIARRARTVVRLPRVAAAPSPSRLASIAICLFGVLAGRSQAQVNLGPVVPLSTASAATLDKGGVSLAKASNGISLAVWADDRTGSYDVYGSLLSASGTRISPLGGFPIVVNAGRHEGEPQVAACGNTFLVVYGAEFNAFEISTVRDLYARRVDTTGNILDPVELVIGNDPTILEHNVRGPTSDGLDTFLVAYRTSEHSIYGSIKAMRISASSGAMLDAPSGITLAMGVTPILRKNPSASYGVGRFLVTWDDGVDGCRYPGESGCIDIYGALLDSASGFPIVMPFPTTTAFSCQEGSWSGFDGTNFVVSHSDERINNCTTADTVAERITPGGVVLDPVDLLTGMIGSIYVASDPAGLPNSVQSGGDVIADPCATVIAYRDFVLGGSSLSFRLRRIDAGGALEFGQLPNLPGQLVASGAHSADVDPRVLGVAIGPHRYLLAYALGDVPYARVAQYATPFQRRVVDQGISRPRGVAIGAQGRIVVANTGAQRIDVFSATGALERRFGAYGAGDGQFINPFGVAVNSQGDICVADSGNHRVQVFSALGVFKRKFGTLGVGANQFRSPLGIAVGPNDDIYVADTDNNRVQVYNALGVFKFTFGSLGSLLGQFRAPRAVAVSPAGQIYVADRDNNRVQKFTATGVPLAVIGGPFRAPRGVALDGDGKLFVADSENNRVVVYRPDGQLQYAFGTAGAAIGQFNMATAVAVDPAGNSYVADFNNNRVQLFGCVP